MKRIIIFLGLLLSFTYILNTVIVVEAATPGINENGGNNGDGSGNDWGWNSIDPETEEF
jgi:hypothetical protein